MNPPDPKSLHNDGTAVDEIRFDSLRLEIAARHIQSAREYTLTLIGDLEEDDWFWMPQPAITHIAWQVGHLAFAQYGLALFRQRGRLAEDAELMSGSFRKTFAKGTAPSPLRQDYPPVAEIRRTFDAVYDQVLRELRHASDAALDDPVDPPHAAFATKYGALLFAANHEMLHAGQIGLLRRLMNKPSLR